MKVCAVLKAHHGLVNSDRLEHVFSIHIQNTKARDRSRTGARGCKVAASLAPYKRQIELSRRRERKWAKNGEFLVSERGTVQTLYINEYNEHAIMMHTTFKQKIRMAKQRTWQAHISAEG